MDQEEISRLVEEFQQSVAVEEDFVDFTSESTINADYRSELLLKRYVVGKIFNNRGVNRGALRSQLPSILQLRGSADIDMVGFNLFVVVFSNDNDRRHALLDGPWHFRDKLLIFKEPKGFEKPSDINFTMFCTWIQCYNLPICCMTPEAMRRVAEKVGVVEEIDIGDGGHCLGQFARARVSREIDKPLQRFVALIKVGEPDKISSVLIRYERLPEFCSACGRVGHAARDCLDSTTMRKRRRLLSNPAEHYELLSVECTWFGKATGIP